MPLTTSTRALRLNGAVTGVIVAAWMRIDERGLVALTSWDTWLMLGFVGLACFCFWTAIGLLLSWAGTKVSSPPT